MSWVWESIVSVIYTTSPPPHRNGQWYRSCTSFQKLDRDWVVGKGVVCVNSELYRHLIDIVSTHDTNTREARQSLSLWTNSWLQARVSTPEWLQNVDILTR